LEVDQEFSFGLASFIGVQISSFLMVFVCLFVFVFFNEIQVEYSHDGFVANNKLCGFVRVLSTGIFFSLDIDILTFS